MGNEGPNEKGPARHFQVWIPWIIAFAAAALIVLANSIITYLFAIRLVYLAKAYQSTILLVFSLSAVFAVILFQHWWQTRTKRAIAANLKNDDASVFEFINGRLTQIIEQEGIDR